jgi:hypothetical protein
MNTNTPFLRVVQKYPESKIKVESVLSAMTQLTLPKCVYIDLKEFISIHYTKQLPHPLLIAQAFRLRFKQYGEEYDLSTIADAVEDITACTHDNNNK